MTLSKCVPVMHMDFQAHRVQMAYTMQCILTRMTDILQAYQAGEGMHYKDVGRLRDLVQQAFQTNKFLT